MAPLWPVLVAGVVPPVIGLWIVLGVMYCLGTVAAFYVWGGDGGRSRWLVPLWPLGLPWAIVALIWVAIVEAIRLRRT